MLLSLLFFAVYILLINTIKQIEICNGTGKQTLEIGPNSYQVLCETGPDSQPWLVMIKRTSQAQFDSYQTFDTIAYNGLGSLDGQFILSLEALHDITSQPSLQAQLYVQMQDENVTRHAYYQSIRIGDRASKYQLHVGTYDSARSNAGDALALHNLMKFTTYDNDNDQDPGGSCFVRYNVSNWYKFCLNWSALGIAKSNTCNNAKGIVWHQFKHYNNCLEKMKFLIRYKACSPCQVCQESSRKIFKCINCGTSGSIPVQGTNFCISNCSHYSSTNYLKYNSQCLNSCPKGTFVRNNQECIECNPACQQCTGALDSDCIICSTDFYDSSTRCLACDSLCDQCTGPGNANCSACKSSSLSVDDIPNKCLSTCSFGYAQIGSVCFKCNEACSTCSDVGPNNCLTCTNSYKHDLTFQFQNPKYCVQKCPNGTVLHNDQCFEQCPIEQRLYKVGENCQYCEEGKVLTSQSCQYLDLSIGQVSVTNLLNIEINFSNDLNFQQFTPSDVEFICDKMQTPQIVFDIQLNNPINTSNKLIISLILKASIEYVNKCSVKINGSKLSSSQSLLRISQSLETNQFTVEPYQHVSPQVTQTISSASQTTQYGTVGMVTGMSGSQIFIAMSMQPLWVVINTNQLILTARLMQVQFPKATNLMFQGLNFLNADIAILEFVYQHTVGFLLQFPQNKDMDKKFNQAGYQSVYLFDNTGIFVSIQIMALMIIILTSLCYACAKSKNNNIISKCTSKILTCLIWNSMLRGLIQTSLDLFVFSILNVMYISFATLSSTISSVVSIIFLIIMLLLPFLMLDIITQPMKIKKDQSFRKKYSQVYEPLRYHKGFQSSIYFPILVFQRLVLVISVYLFNFSAAVQSGIMMVYTLLFCAYLIKYKPFESRYNSISNVFNQFFLFFFFAICFAMNFIPDTYPGVIQIIGYFLLVAIFANLGIHLFIVLIIGLINCRKGCKKDKIDKIDRDKRLKVVPDSMDFTLKSERDKDFLSNQIDHNQDFKDILRKRKTSCHSSGYDSKELSIVQEEQLQSIEQYM